MRHLLLSVLAACALALAACAAPSGGAPSADPAATAIATTTTAYTSLNAAISAADAAFVAGALKGPDAAKALQAFQVSKRGLDAALVSLRASAAAPATAASGVK